MIVPCPSCRRKQRLSIRNIEDESVCDACGAPLEHCDVPIEVDDRDFKAWLQWAERPVFVDFWASWCDVCRRVAPEVRRLARRHGSNIWVLTLDVVHNPRAALEHDIHYLPTFALFEHGESRHTASGYMTADQMERQFELST
jgi:thioredoxin-like negative regulator of GroEL